MMRSASLDSGCGFMQCERHTYPRKGTSVDYEHSLATVFKELIEVGFSLSRFSFFHVDVTA